MTTAFAPRVAALTLPRVNTAALTLAVLVAAAVVVRLPHFGDPDFHLDEDFYLLVGDRMLHGALPYVDIWDRKPIGLFAMYAAIRLLGGDGFVQYQIVAALFAGGTAAIIAAFSRPVAGWSGGMVAGLAYLLWMETIEGGGGQSPVFYNLFVAGGAWCTLSALAAGEPRRFRTCAFGAMALCGLAIQVKYTAVFESGYFGLALAWASLRQSARRREALALIAGLAVTALGPTLLALAVYAGIGELHAFWYANFVSIFLRGATVPAELRYRLGQIALHIIPFAFCALASLWQVRGSRDAETRRWQWFVAGWLAAASAGLFAIGTLLYHYMLPLLVPLSIAASPIFRRKPLGQVLAGLMIWLPLSQLNYPDFESTRYSREKIAALAALVPPGVDRGCLHLFAGPPSLYQITHACFVSPYIFPNHLIGAAETDAIDQVAQTRRVMAARPLAIITNDAQPNMNPASLHVLEAMRARYYRWAGRVAIRGYVHDVWIRR